MLIIHKGGVSFKMKNIFKVYNIKTGVIYDKTKLVICEYNLKFFLTRRYKENSFSISDAGDYTLSTININSEGDIIISFFYPNTTRVYKYDSNTSSLTEIYSITSVIRVRNRYLSSTTPIVNESIKTLGGLSSDLKIKVKKRFIGNTSMIPLQAFIDEYNRTCIVINLAIKNNNHTYTIAIHDNNEIKVIDIGSVPLMKDVEPDINLLLTMISSLKLTVDYRNITHRKKNELTFLAAIEL